MDQQDIQVPIYTPDTQTYPQRVAYFCMEYAIDQSLKIYSGGLGFLAGSHMRSAYELKQNMIGIGILWKFGYYDQVKDDSHRMRVQYIKKYYPMLKDSGIVVHVKVNGHLVFVKALYLEPEIFGTVPMYLLTTDFEKNDYLSRTITHKLYDSNTPTRIAQNIVLGIGGAKVVEALGGADIYHLNEAHSLPLCFYLLTKHDKLEEVKKRVIFTTHTPEKAGNPESDIQFLSSMGFFNDIPVESVKEILQNNKDKINHTHLALCMSKISNGVSKLHKRVSNEMWQAYPGINEIISITNGQNKSYWTDPILEAAFQEKDTAKLKVRKKELKKALFAEVADQSGTWLDPNVLTLVWARRFASYKRPNLILKNLARFYALISDDEKPIQVIWAGKPHPADQQGIDLFNELVHLTYKHPRMSILTGYELRLSAQLKRGADIWLNTPRRPREASGTSGMSAAMNAAINFTIYDGWIPEFAKHRENCFVIPPVDYNLPQEAQDEIDAQNLMDILEHEIIPMYYQKQDTWLKMIMQSMEDVYPAFGSDRMAEEYYEQMVKA